MNTREKSDEYLKLHSTRSACTRVHTMSERINEQLQEWKVRMYSSPYLFNIPQSRISKERESIRERIALEEARQRAREEEYAELVTTCAKLLGGILLATAVCGVIKYIFS